MDPQELLKDFATWSPTKQFNFLVELIRELTDEQCDALENYLNNLPE